MERWEHFTTREIYSLKYFFIKSESFFFFFFFLECVFVSSSAGSMFYGIRINEILFSFALCLQFNRCKWQSNKVFLDELLPQKHHWVNAFSSSLSRYFRASSGSSHARKFRFSVSSWSVVHHRGFSSSLASDSSRFRCCRSPRPPVFTYIRFLWQRIDFFFKFIYNFTLLRILAIWRMNIHFLEKKKTICFPEQRIEIENNMVE